MPTDRRDAASLEDLYDAYGASCYRLAHRMVAEDQLACMIVRDVFLALWAGESRFDPARGSVQTSLLCATHHRAVVTLRRPPNGSGADAESFNALALETLRDLAARHEGRQRSHAATQS